MEKSQLDEILKLTTELSVIADERSSDTGIAITALKSAADVLENVVAMKAMQVAMSNALKRD